jgi:hypothetical protein
MKMPWQTSYADFAWLACVHAANKSVFFSFSFVYEKLCPATSMTEYHMTKIKRRVVKDLVVYFTNGCPK